MDKKKKAVQWHVTGRCRIAWLRSFYKNGTDNRLFPCKTLHGKSGLTNLALTHKFYFAVMNWRFHTMNSKFHVVFTLVEPTLWPHFLVTFYQRKRKFSACLDQKWNCLFFSEKVFFPSLEEVLFWTLLQILTPNLHVQNEECRLNTRRTYGKLQWFKWDCMFGSLINSILCTKQPNLFLHFFKSFALISNFRNQNTSRNVFQDFRQSYMLSPHWIKIHQWQTASMMQRRSEGHTSGCDWWNLIRSVDNL